MNATEMLALGLGAAFVVLMVIVIIAMNSNPEGFDD